ncbi:restriction endonuclease [Fuscovulum blasticum DSM 2131]|uniref:Restriction endonuclease n=1 Tax=Fuscovulum blasticum DSM 2131 TaxID=1188250 RepID=A0A2T4JD66_FUSBL|nr:restriction endonuclease [Fuscovulum blasticum DSM 2131]
MDFAGKVAELVKRSKHATQHAITEEATKTAVVLPFIQALGFDVFNIEEVIPEFIADVGIKKGEKIDFAIKIGGKIQILVEVKPISTALGSAQYSQLFRYFGTTDAKLAILINGREVWFFSDIDEKNKMDKKPFFVFDFQNHDERQIEELARFQKSIFDVDAILDAASNMRYVKAASAMISSQLAAPDDDFVRYVGKQIYDGSLTKAVVEMLRPAIQAALDEVVRNRIQERLNVTFGKEQPSVEPTDRKAAEEPASSSDVVTTEDEQMAFMISRAIVAKVIDVKRIVLRDAKSYCSVLIDDNNRRPLCRFYFNAKSVKSVGVFDAEKNETRHNISDLSDIYQLSANLEATAKQYA